LSALELMQHPPIRVLHVVEATVGGVRAHLQAIVTGLDKHRFQSVVACPPRRHNAYGDDQFVGYLTSAGIAVLPLPMRRSINPVADAVALLRLLAILRRERFDMIHLHSSKAGFLGRLAAKIAGHAAVVYTPHGLAFLGDHGRAQRQLYLALERIAGRWCDCVIAVSASERDLIMSSRISAADRVVCIENGIAPIHLPAAYDRTALRRTLGQPLAAPLIGSVARLTPQKNPYMFLDAAALVLRQRPDARFVWCGAGELADAAERYAIALGIGHACRFLGYREDAQQIIAALAIFWLTSNYEGLPIAALEAMALGVPVVATDVIGTRDLLRGAAGLLIPPGDAGALAATTIELARLPEQREQLARTGYARYSQYGTAERMIDEIQQLYTRLLSRRAHTVGRPMHANKTAP